MATDDDAIGSGKELVFSRIEIIAIIMMVLQFFLPFFLLHVCSYPNAFSLKAFLWSRHEKYAPVFAVGWSDDARIQLCLCVCACMFHAVQHHQMSRTFWLPSTLKMEFQIFKNMQIEKFVESNAFSVTYLVHKAGTRLFHFSLSSKIKARENSFQWDREWETENVKGKRMANEPTSNVKLKKKRVKSSKNEYIRREVGCKGGETSTGLKVRMNRMYEVLCSVSTD